MEYLRGRYDSYLSMTMLAHFCVVAGIEYVTKDNVVSADLDSKIEFRCNEDLYYDIFATEQRIVAEETYVTRSAVVSTALNIGLSILDDLIDQADNTGLLSYQDYILLHDLDQMINKTGGSVSLAEEALSRTSNDQLIQVASEALEEDRDLFKLSSWTREVEKRKHTDVYQDLKRL